MTVAIWPVTLRCSTLFRMAWTIARSARDAWLIAVSSAMGCLAADGMRQRFWVSPPKKVVILILIILRVVSKSRALILSVMGLFPELLPWLLLLACWP